MDSITKSTLKRDDILKAATNLMLGKGYSASTVDKICSQAGVTKGCFFHHFKSKEEMTKEIIEHSANRFLCILNGECGCCPDMRPLDRVYAFVDHAIAFSKNAENKGCLVGTLVQENWETHPELRAICHKNLDRITESFRQNLEAAANADKRWSAPDLDGLALSFMATIQGSMILIKASGDRSIMEKTLTVFKNHLQEIFGKV